MILYKYRLFRPLWKGEKEGKTRKEGMFVVLEGLAIMLWFSGGSEDGQREGMNLRKSKKNRRWKIYKKDTTICLNNHNRYCTQQL